jgi:hypothetical protein
MKNAAAASISEMLDISYSDLSINHGIFICHMNTKDSIEPVIVSLDFSEGSMKVKQINEKGETR